MIAAAGGVEAALRQHRGYSLHESERVIMDRRSNLVRASSVIKGRFMLSNMHLYFEPFGKKSDNGDMDELDDMSDGGSDTERSRSRSRAGSTASWSSRRRSSSFAIRRI